MEDILIDKEHGTLLFDLILLYQLKSSYTDFHRFNQFRMLKPI